MRDQRTVVVTGGASGIGRAVVDEFARLGDRVYVADLRSEPARHLVDELSAQDRTASALQLDVSDPRAVDAAVDAVVAETGRIDVIVNNAGIGRVGDHVVDTSTELWEQSIGVMQSGVFYGMRAAGRQFLAQGSGCAINITSIRGFSANPGRIAYCAAKAAVVMMTRVAAAEWAGRGARAVAIAPGFQRTEMFTADEARVPGTEARLAGVVPAGRIGEPTEVAKLAAFLASPDAAYINGECVTIDGALTCVPSDADFLGRAD